jgi:hypothetical protein
VESTWAPIRVGDTAHVAVFVRDHSERMQAKELAIRHFEAFIRTPRRVKPRVR